MRYIYNKSPNKQICLRRQKKSLTVLTHTETNIRPMTEIVLSSCACKTKFTCNKSLFDLGLYIRILPHMIPGVKDVRI